MRIPKITGIETEYGILVRGSNASDPVMASRLLVRHCEEAAGMIPGPEAMDETLGRAESPIRRVVIAEDDFDDEGSRGRNLPKRACSTACKGKAWWKDCCATRMSKGWWKTLRKTLVPICEDTA